MAVEWIDLQGRPVPIIQFGRSPIYKALTDTRDGFGLNSMVLSSNCKKHTKYMVNPIIFEFKDVGEIERLIRSLVQLRDSFGTPNPYSPQDKNIKQLETNS